MTAAFQFKIDSYTRSQLHIQSLNCIHTHLQNGLHVFSLFFYFRSSFLRFHYCNLLVLSLSLHLPILPNSTKVDDSPKNQVNYVHSRQIQIGVSTQSKERKIKGFLSIASIDFVFFSRKINYFFFYLCISFGFEQTTSQTRRHNGRTFRSNQSNIKSFIKRQRKAMEKGFRFGWRKERCATSLSICWWVVYHFCWFGRLFTTSFSHFILVCLQLIRFVRNNQKRFSFDEPHTQWTKYWIMNNFFFFFFRMCEKCTNVHSKCCSYRTFSHCWNCLMYRFGLNESKAQRRKKNNRNNTIWMIFSFIVFEIELNFWKRSKFYSVKSSRLLKLTIHSFLFFFFVVRLLFSLLSAK